MLPIKWNLSNSTFTWCYLFSLKFSLLSLWTNSCDVSIQMKPLQQYFQMVLFLLVCRSNFWVCGWNPMVLPSKWNLLSRIWDLFARFIQVWEYFVKVADTICFSSHSHRPYQTVGFRYRSGWGLYPKVQKRGSCECNNNHIFLNNHLFFETFSWEGRALD